MCLPSLEARIGGNSDAALVLRVFQEASQTPVLPMYEEWNDANFAIDGLDANVAAEFTRIWIKV